MARVALVLSGGGAKGAFTVGVLKELLPRLQELGRSPSIFAATSTGAFIAPMALTGRIDELAMFYTNLTTAQILALRTPGEAFSSPSLADSTPIRNILAQNLTDQICQEVLAGANGVTCLLSAVSLQTGELFMFHAGAPIPPSADALIDDIPAWRYAELGSPEHLRSAVLASGSEPARLDPVRIVYEPITTDSPRMRVTGIGGAIPMLWRPPFVAQFVDGGVRALAPVEVAIALGADDLFLVANQPSRKERLKPSRASTAGVETFSSTFGVLGRTIELFQLRIGDADQAAGETLGTARFHVIRPDPPLTGDSLDFRPAVMSQRLLQGRMTGQAFVETYTPPSDGGGGPIA
jgi:predicted acylesterase/phospholipase RssA